MSDTDMYTEKPYLNKLATTGVTDFDRITESQITSAKISFANTIKADNKFSPELRYFKDDKLIAQIVCRAISSDGDSIARAMREIACMIPLLKPDYVLFLCDTRYRVEKITQEEIDKLQNDEDLFDNIKPPENTLDAFFTLKVWSDLKVCTTMESYLLDNNKNIWWLHIADFPEKMNHHDDSSPMFKAIKAFFYYPIMPNFSTTDLVLVLRSFGHIINFSKEFSYS